MKSRPVSDRFIQEVNYQSSELTEESFGFLFRQSGLYTKSNLFRPPFPFKPKHPKLPRIGNAENQVSINLDQLRNEERDGLQIKPFLLYEEFRLDVDGLYPQMMASGFLKFPGVNYIAKLTKKTSNIYFGKIWYKYGNVASFPYTKIKVEVRNRFSPSSKKVTVKFYGPGGIKKTSTYDYKSRYFRGVNFEYDCEEGVTPIMNINTHEHPNRSSSMPNINLSLDAVFRRAGFETSRAEDSIVPSRITGSNGTWSDMEMHDAMQRYWSRYRNAPQWALWTFFANQHDRGEGLGGIMFDSIGGNHRQGTAIFNDSFISRVPSDDPNPTAYRRRMKFWTAIHEMGHAFNLAHSWQKSLGTPWIPLQDEPEARSFMNYPARVRGGVNAFFADFNYRFSDSELLFIRHAPEQFVQMGNNAWFEQHGLSDDEHELSEDLAVEVRLNKPNNIVEYMEPVYIEIKLTNTTNEKISIDKNVIADLHHLAIEIQKPNGQLVNCKAFVKHLFKQEEGQLEAGDSMYNSFFISAGIDEWYIRDSGTYTIKASLYEDGKVYQSNSFEINVLNPKSERQAALSSQYFTDEVARVLYFNGSKVLSDANETLANVLEAIPEAKVAMHAAVALATPHTKKYKTLAFTDEKETKEEEQVAKSKAIKTDKVNNKLAIQYLSQATENLDKFMDSYGHIQSEKQINVMTNAMIANRSKKAAKENVMKMIAKFEERGVATKVLEQLKSNAKKM